MDRIRLSEGHFGQAHTYTHHPHTFPPPAEQLQPQIPHSDPFQTTRDPFLHRRRGSFGLQQARAWPQAQQGNANANVHANANGHSHPSSTPPQQSPSPQTRPPPSHAPNGLGAMSLPYDPSRRRSLGGGSSGSPPLIAQGPLEPPLTHHAFPSRQMPPPSPPHLPSSASSLPGSAPRGPPTASPFAGVRDLASFASHRPSGGMSISSILGGGDERKPQTSPSFPPLPTGTPKSMPPPSPGRARASSMREPGARSGRESSPPSFRLGEPRMMGASFGQDRPAHEQPRQNGLFGSPNFQHGFRAFQPMQMEQRGGFDGHPTPGRPSSQPVEQGPPRSIEDIIRRDAPYEGRFATFRHFGEPQMPGVRTEPSSRHEMAPFHNGKGPTSQPVEQESFRSPQMERRRSQTGPTGFRQGSFGTPMREDQAGLFRPAFQPDGFREPMELGRLQDLRRMTPRSSPPLSDLAAAERMRLGLSDRPLTFEEHQRMEAMQREQQQNRKESDGSAHRALLNISPELNRKGRNSPLPQAVQGASSRHVGPGGNNPGIKQEFGRMFSGLGSGVGTATPTAGHSVNGTTTPSRMTPSRHIDSGDLVRTAVAEIEGSRAGSRGRGGKRNGRYRVDEERTNGTETPEHQRGNKRAKTNAVATHHHHHVHPHHHHHHHHEAIDNAPSPFNMLRLGANPMAQQPPINTASSHHHHHHHTAHAHPGHHHHLQARLPPPRKPTITVSNQRLLDEAAKKPRKHLGSQLYRTEVYAPSPADIPLDAPVKYATRMQPLPLFTGKENCTYAIRVPRSQLGSATGPDRESSREHFRQICRSRNLWGTEVYTDDSDVVAAAVHSGWIKGDFGDDVNDLLAEEQSEELPPSPPPVKVPEGKDAHITVLILPPLELYASTTRHFVRSKEWRGLHNGMSFMVIGVEFVDDNMMERGAKAKKARLAGEEKRRAEAVEGLLGLFKGGAKGIGVEGSGGGGGVVRVGA